MTPLSLSLDFVTKGAPLETEMGQEMLPRLKGILEFSSNTFLVLLIYFDSTSSVCLVFI